MTQRSAIADTICRTIELGVTITDAAIDAEDQTHLFCQVVAPKDTCPTCGQAGRLRDHVDREVADLPIVGHPTRLHLKVPRYACINTACATSVFRADFLNELDAPPSGGSESTVSGVEGLPVGSALLVVKRGPNAGSRFLLDQASTSAGRHPDSDIFLDDVTVSRRHAEFRLESGEFQVVDVGSLNGTYVNREPVDSAVLANGDEVQIGKFRLVFLTGPRTDDGGPGS